MKFFFIGLLLCFASPIAIAYPEPLSSFLNWNQRSLRQAGNSENVMSRLLPRMNRPEQHSSTTKKPSPVISKRPGIVPSTSQGFKPTLERSSSKRKETTPLATTPSQRPRITGPSSVNSGTVSKLTHSPSGKPPLHPSFKNSPAYAVKMKQLADRKAQQQEVIRQWHNVLPDASFLSGEPKTANTLPDLPQIHSSPHLPPPWRSQAITPSTGGFISVN